MIEWRYLGRSRESVEHHRTDAVSIGADADLLEAHGELQVKAAKSHYRARMDEPANG